jgi:hypothetical protein
MVTCSCTERSLFYALLLFWFVGVLLVLGYHPHNCIYFSLPPAGSGHLTPTNPHETPEADWFYTFTHRLTLGPYVFISCAVQLILFCTWYAQLANHERLHARSERESLRGKRMREYGWMRCIRSVFHDDDDNEVLAPDAERFDCVCGCCCLYSTACALLIFNVGVMILLIYFLLLGVGTLESTARYAQNPECRYGYPAGVYIFSLNAALLLLYLILLLIRCLCHARTVAQNVVEIGKKIHNRIQTRKGRRIGNGNAPGKSSAYAQLDRPMDAELGLELSDDEQGDEGEEQVELELHDLAMEDEQMDGMFNQQAAQQHTRIQAFPHMQQFRSQNNNQSQLLSSPHTRIAPPTSDTNGHEQMSSSNMAELDSDTREMLEMLEGPDDPSLNDTTAEHQRAALDAMERETLP